MAAVQLDQHQRQAADWRTGWAVVAAAAGSGKTTVLVERTVALLQEGVPPDQICILVYNKAAATTLQQRLQARMGPRSRGIAVTFHSFGLSLWRAAHGGRMPKLVGKDKGPNGRVLTYGSVAGPLIRKLKVGLSVKESETIVSAMREKLWNYADPKTVKRVQKHFGVGRKGLLAMAQHYQGVKETSGFLDYSDMIAEPAHGILARDPAWLAVLPSFRHVMVDECQDMNEARFMLATTLGQSAQSLLAVGDLRQSINGFTGAEPGLFEALANHEAVQLITFPVNRRSTQRIIEAANAIAEGQPWNLGGATVARPGATRGDPVQLWETESPGQEVTRIAEEIQRCVAHGLPLAQPDSRSSYAVLARTRAWLLTIQVGLLHRGYPVRVLGGGSGLFASLPGRQVKAYLTAAEGEVDWSLLDVANEPKRYARRGDVGGAIRFGMDSKREVTDALSEYARTHDFEKTYQPTALRKLARDIGNLQKRSWPERCARIADFLLENIEAEGGITRIEVEDTVEIIRLICRVASELGNRAAIAEYERMEQEQAKKVGAIELGTAHIAKGQEWPWVCVAGANQRKFPHEKAHDIAEERRLFYVAVTRGMRHVSISAGGAPSDFFGILENK
jgi:DNA helicase II / ATP-dependent DNA helicase PcrA